MIEYLKIEDKWQGAKLLNEHVKEFSFAKDFDNNIAYYDVLLDNLIKDRTVIVSKDNNGNIDGTLICARVPMILNPSKMQLHVIVTWVKKDKRGSSIFYRMNSFLDKEFKNMDKIYYDYHIDNTTNINFEKLGYTKSDTLYVKEQGK